MKKFLKILAYVLLFCAAAIFIIPIVFEGNILKLIKKTANNNLEAIFEYEDGSLSIWRNFPNAEVSLDKVSLVNNRAFKGDTLLMADQISLKLPLLQLFKSGSNLKVTSFEVDGADISFKTAKDGMANYNIFKTSDTTVEEEKATESPMELLLEAYHIKNSHITYQDSESKVFLELSDLNHSGIGNLSANITNLDTKSTALASFTYDSIAYLDKHLLDLTALIGIDINTNTYSFKENTALINQLPLVFEGYVKRHATHQEIDLKFKTPSSDFKNFLALIPKVYSKNIEGVETTGNFDLNGKFFGTIDSTHIPKFNIYINSDNASFKYPDLPKQLENIQIKTEIANNTGFAKDSYVNIDTLSFRIDQEVFKATARLSDLTTNLKTEASLKGDLDLRKLAQIYPADQFQNLKGILSVDAKAKFDMLSIEQKKYENTKIQGLFNIKDFEYLSEELSDTLFIQNTSVTFNDKNVKLNQFNAAIGETDMKANGSINNLLGFLFNKEAIEGKFDLKSQRFNLNDFKVASIEDQKDTLSSQASPKSIKIPSFINATVKAEAETLIYDDITLKNMSGLLLIKDEQAELKNMSAKVFDGKVGFNGLVSTKAAVPTFEMTLDIEKFDIGNSFKQLSLFKSLVPIAQTLQGKFNTALALSGTLDENFAPDLSSLKGKAIAEVLSASFTKNAPLIKELQTKMNFLDGKKINLNNLKTALSFKDGKVQIDPFTINYEDVKMDISGGHGFDNSLGYKAIIDVPAKYLGTEGSKILAQLSSAEQESIKIPINAQVSGTILKPEIKTDFKQAVNDLTKRLIASQKEKVKDKASDLIEDLLKGRKKENDSTVVDSVKIKLEDKTKDAAKNLLNNLLKSKKKDTIKKN